MRRWVLPLGLVVGVASAPACGRSVDRESPAAPLPEVSTYEEFVAAYAEIVCSAAAPCCSSPFDEGECIAGMGEYLLDRRSEWMEGVEYDRERGKACMAALAPIRGACAVPVPELTRKGAACRVGVNDEAECDFPCTDVARGTRQPGETCAANESCSGPSMCTGICVAVTFAGEGEACGATGFEDGAFHGCNGLLGLYCGGDPSTCQLEGGRDGEACWAPMGDYTPRACAPDLGCDDGTCRPLRPAGAACTADQQCESLACTETCLDPGDLDFDVTKLTYYCPAT